MTASAMSRPAAVPQSGGSARAIALAVVMHVLLGALLFFGIRWQSSAPAVIQAELWSATPQVAAPPPRPVPPPPKVEAPTPPVVKLAPEPPQPKADIVEKAPAKVEPPKKVPPKVEPRVDPPKVVQKQPPKVETPLPKAPPKPSQDVQKLLQQAAVETQKPPSDVSSLIAAAGREGKDQQTSGPRGDQNGYIAKLQAAIRSQMRYPGTAAGNPFVSMKIEQLPNGEVLNVTVLKGSGVQAFDDAVERAVRAASPLPRPTQGPAPRELEVRYNMYDKS